MSDRLVRFGVTVPADTVEEFDQQLKRTGKSNRSVIVRQLMRRYVAEERWREQEGQVYGTVTLMYDHHSSGISKELTSVQHDYGGNIVCTTHVHVTHNSCLECIILKGDASCVKTFVDALGKIKGLKSVETVIASGI